MCNAHKHYLLFPDLEQRTAFIKSLKEQSIGAVFKYIPLHDSPMCKEYGRTPGDVESISYRKTGPINKNIIELGF